MLPISRDEQKARLKDRLEDKRKNWKFRAGDLQRLMVEARIGQSIALTVLRGETLLNLNIVPVELK